ncbi:MAG: hypothetical protein C0524_16255 [Rhodobacter sp.]|nr:hypothetical protein [Rhodobacter sp.]
MTSPDPLAEAMDDLRRAIAVLSQHLSTPDDLAVLDRLQAATAQLSLRTPSQPIGLRDFDPACFRRLLDLAGPGMAGTLLTHLVADLGNCRTLTRAGAAGLDWDALREGSHVLISLAGSVGAVSLQALAEALNTAAHRQDVAATQGLLMPSLLAELDALIALVRATPAPEGDIS